MNKLTLTCLSATLVGASLLVASPAMAATPSPELTGKSYSLTQTVVNNSDVPLTLTDISVSKGTVQPGYAQTIAPHTSDVYTATNQGTGAHLTLDFAEPDGGTVNVNTDVPQVDGNWSIGTITQGTDLSAGAIKMGGGDTPTALFVVNTTSGHQVVADSTDGGPSLA
jgi:hypothetical protein